MAEKDAKKKKCLIHIVKGCASKTRLFSKNSWTRVRDAAETRQDHIHKTFGKLLQGNVLDGVHYHPECYARYTNSEHLERLKNCRRSPRKRPKHTTDEEQGPSPPKMLCRSSVDEGLQDKAVTCIICRNPEKWGPDGKNKEPLNTCELDSVETNIKTAARIRKNARVQLDVEGKDLKASEVKYHMSCYSTFTNKNSLDCIEKRDKSQTDLYCQAFEVVQVNIDDLVLQKKEKVSMSSLYSAYEGKMKELKCTTASSRRKLKSRIKKHYGDSVKFAQPSPNQPEVVYSSSLQVKEVLESCLQTLESHTENENDLQEDCIDDLINDESSIDIYHCGILIHNILSNIEDTMPWPPSPADITHEKIDVPDLLFNLVAYIITGTSKPVSDGKLPVDSDIERLVLSVSQDLINISRKGRIKTVKNIGLAVALRNLTGNKEVLTLLNRFGHTLSYSKIQDFEKELVKKYHGEQQNSIIMPSTMKQGVFSTFVWDNNDLCEETLSGAGTTHVTNGIIIQRQDVESVVDHQEEELPGERMENVVLQYNRTDRVGPSPLEVNAAQLLHTSSDDFDRFANMDVLWLILRQHPTDSLFNVDVRSAQTVPGWSAFNASIRDAAPTASEVGFLQPVNESPTELSAMYSILKRSQHFAKLLGLSEADCVFDQACFAKACQLKWASPDEFANLSFRLGAFHTIPVFVSIIFKRFADAGLVDVITESTIIANGSLAGVCTGHHYNRAVRTLKLVYEALSRLLWKQFGNHLNEIEDIDIDLEFLQEKVLQLRENVTGQEFNEFLLSDATSDLIDLFQNFRKRDQGPMFRFWNSFLEMVELMLVFIRACRVGNWELHLYCFRKMLTWFFAYDNINYARYGSYYYTSMMALESTHPQIHENLHAGHFGVQMSNINTFAKIPEDQTIEETVNRSSKIPGGIVGKSTNTQAVCQWVETAADRSQITENVRDMAGLKNEDLSWTHKEGTPARIKRDESDIRKVLEVVQSMHDPFVQSDELTSISSGIKVSEETESDLFRAHEKGEQCLEAFMQQRILSQNVPYFDPIKKLKLRTFTNETVQKSVKVKGRDVIVKADRSFFCKLVIIAKARDLDLYDVYSHELGPIPWAIATPHGTLYKATKSLLLDILEKNVPAVQHAPLGSVWIIDAFANIQILKKPVLEHEPVQQGGSKWKPNTFSDVAESIMSSVCSITKPQPLRIDFVVDTYQELSIKQTERERRSKTPGRRIKVNAACQKAPASWSDYMSNSSNKQELPEFLHSEWSSDTNGFYATRLSNTQLFVCHGSKCNRLHVLDQSVQSAEITQLSFMAEEADTRLLYHAKQAADTQACPAIIIRSSDTDVMVLAIYFQREIHSRILVQRQAKKKKWKFVDIPSVQRQLGLDICEALPGFHSFSGCDTTSGFVGKSKNPFFKLLTTNAEFRQAMKDLGKELPVSDAVTAACEAAICKLYGHNSTDVNRVRYDMLSKGAESHEIPPTKDALMLHVKRANYQAYLWKMALIPNFVPPSPDGHGWKIKDRSIEIAWMTQEPAPRAVLELVSCKSCQLCTTRRCPCKGRGFKCTDSCGCNANICENSEDSGRQNAEGADLIDDSDEEY